MNNFKISDLAELQLLEKEIIKDLLEINSLKKNEKLIKLQTQLDDAVAELTLLTDRYNALEHERKKIEGTIKIQNDKIKRNEEKLFSGTITNAKELVNYQEEIKQFKNSNDDLENKELEIMFSIDEIKPKLKTFEELKNSKSVEMEELKSVIAASIKEIENKISRLRNARTVALKKIPEETLVIYNDIKQKKGGVALAIMKENVCDVCNMELPVGELEKIKDPEKIHRCPTCRRLLIINTTEIESTKERVKNISCITEKS